VEWLPSSPLICVIGGSLDPTHLHLNIQKHLLTDGL
jgi:hypothetical protein